MTETDTRGRWLTNEELRDARERLPILYVDAVPVRVDERGLVTEIGLLLRASAGGEINHELVSGRVLYHERVRDALLRHLEKDLGPLAMPRIPLAPQPCHTVLGATGRSTTTPHRHRARWPRPTHLARSPPPPRPASGHRSTAGAAQRPKLL